MPVFQQIRVDYGGFMPEVLGTLLEALKEKILGLLLKYFPVEVADPVPKLRFPEMQEIDG